MTTTSRSMLRTLTRDAREVLVSSPYSGEEHHLVLESVNVADGVLAEALAGLRPLTEEYPLRGYEESFNWQELVDTLPREFTGQSRATDADNRGILLHSLLLHSTLHLRLGKTTLFRRSSPHRSQLLRRAPQVLVEIPPRPHRTT
jgi:hypothetical protein